MSLHATGKRGDSQVMERAVSRAVSCACRCVDVGVGAGVWMWVWVQVCGCGCGCCFGGADGCIHLIMLDDVCQCCCLLMFVCLPLSRHVPCRTW